MLCEEFLHILIEFFLIKERRFDYFFPFLIVKLYFLVRSLMKRPSSHHWVHAVLILEYNYLEACSNTFAILQEYRYSSILK